MAQEQTTQFLKGLKPSFFPFFLSELKLRPPPTIYEIARGFQI